MEADNEEHLLLTVSTTVLANRLLNSSVIKKQLERLYDLLIDKALLELTIKAIALFLMVVTQIARQQGE